MAGQKVEYLLFHRSHQGPEYEGDWAWTPPSGARYPGEAVDDCARRELEEETVLNLAPRRIGSGTEDWALYLVEVGPADEIRLGVEHDRFEWVSLEEAVERCKPDLVGRVFWMVEERLR